MKVYSPIGSKERFLEMFQNVNKIKLNESMFKSNGDINEINSFNEQVENAETILNTAYNQLKAKDINIKQTNTQSDNNDNFVELICFDAQNNEIVFRFEILSTEEDQDNVFGVNKVMLNNFIFKSSNGDENVELAEDGLKNFNTKYGDELFDVIKEYINIEDSEPDDMEDLSEEIKLIDAIKQDSYPYGGGSSRMQTGKAYADEKPTNPNVRVKSNELDKYIQENDNRQPSADEMTKIYDDLMKKNGRLNPDYSPTFIEVKKEYEKMKSGNAPIEKKRAIPQGLEDLWEEDLTPDENPEETPDLENIDIEQLSQDKEQSGEMLQGGLGDNKSLLDFNKDQIIKGMSVEKEHTDDPIIAIEIVLDHLSEKPDYYTVKDNPEDSAQFNASAEAAEDDENLETNPDMGMGSPAEFAKNFQSDDEDMTNLLLGYKPKNVGDEIDENFLEEMAADPKELEIELKQEPYISIRNSIVQKFKNDKRLGGLNPEAKAYDIVKGNYDWINKGKNRYNVEQIADMYFNKYLKDNKIVNTPQPNVPQKNVTQQVTPQTNVPQQKVSQFNVQQQPDSQIMQNFHKKMSGHPEYIAVMQALKNELSKSGGTGEEIDTKAVDLFGKNYTKISRFLLNKMKPEVIVKHLLTSPNINEDEELNELMSKVTPINEMLSLNEADAEKVYSPNLQKEPYATVLRLLTEMFKLDMRFRRYGNDPVLLAKNRADSYIDAITKGLETKTPQEIAKVIYDRDANALSTDGQVKPLNFNFTQGENPNVVGVSNDSTKGAKNYINAQRYSSIINHFRNEFKKANLNLTPAQVDAQINDIIHVNKNNVDNSISNPERIPLSNTAFSSIYGYDPQQGDVME
jgi:hypothetical protein